VFETERVEKLMLKKDKTKEKNCLFFASDYHFEMISLPYINKSIKNNKEVIVISENNLENTINKLLLQVNLEDDEKDKILKIDWKNNDFDKFKEIKEADKEKRNTIVFIKGKENYIKNVNKNLENWIKDDNKIEIIDCYDINEIEENVEEITKKYNNILVTAGMKKL
jgi:ABC-type antimicrobial peptide transport system permease subunit